MWFGFNAFSEESLSIMRKNLASKQISTPEYKGMQGKIKQNNCVQCSLSIMEINFNCIPFKNLCRFFWDQLDVTVEMSYIIIFYNIQSSDSDSNGNTMILL